MSWGQDWGATLRGAARVCRKDLQIELRTRDVTTTTTLFAVLVVVIASLSFYLDPLVARKLAPGVLWVAIAFAGLLAMGRGWAREREMDALRGLLLTPLPRAAIFLGKAAAHLVFLLVVEAIVCPLVAVFFRVNLFEVAGPLALLLVLGSLGFVLAGTLFGVLTVRTGARDLALSVVVFPLITPALLGGVAATRQLFVNDAGLAELAGWLRILGAFDLVFLVAGTMLFDALVRD
ncbi:MAG: heme exporter protein CcmB [Myxococcota bacterium]